MDALDPGLLRRAVRAADPGAEVAEVRGLRDGGSPWLLRLRRGGRTRGVVLRVGHGKDGAAGLGTEVAALTLAAEHGLPAPRLLAADLAGDPPVVLVEQVAGSSAIPPQRPPARLRALGRAAAALHAVAQAPTPALPRRDRPIALEDFAALRRRRPPRLLLQEAEERLAALRRRRPPRLLLQEAEERLAALPPPAQSEVLVHGDLWQGNALWAGDTLVALIDWDCAGAGPPGVDVGSLRCDAAICFGLEAADDIRDGWEEATGRPLADLPRWDAVAALSTPPDMGWFLGAIAGQGRPDLTRELLVGRRDAFLRAALDRLDDR